MNKEKLLVHWQALSWKTVFISFNKYAPKFVFILLLVFLAQTFATLTWSFFASDDTADIANKTLSPVVATNLRQVKQPVANLNSVVQYHLFGNAASRSPSVVQREVVNAPDTRLHLILKGVFASTNPKKALAIIATKKGKGKSYRIGDKLSGGAILHAVYADRVLLKRNGKLETLRLPKATTKNLYSKRMSLPQVTEERMVGLMSSGNKAKLKNLRKTLLTDPSKVWKQVRINPVMKNGKVQGYTLFHNDQVLMNSLGIRRTDIILAVNGEYLSDPATLYGLMNMLSEKQGFDVTIERNGQQQSIQLNF